MAAPDRSWTITPVLASFFAFVIVAIVWADGGVTAIADRLTSPPGSTEAAPAGPSFGSPADTDDDGDSYAAADNGDAGGVAAPATGGGTSGSAAAPAVASALDNPCVEGDEAHCKRHALDGFYRAVYDEKAGTLGRAVRVSWYGDSVVATDALPGHLRARIQAELGDGGPGFVYAVPPHQFCEHEAITRAKSGTWYPHAISTLQTGDGFYGVGGSTAETADGHSTIKLVKGKVTNVELYYLAQPGGGTAKVSADGTEIIAATTGADAKTAGYAATKVDGGASKFEISEAGRVRLFGLDLENDKGAVVDNLGIVSVNVKSWGVADPEHWASELSHRHADLVLIMIGANEAEWLGPSDQDTKHYREHYEKVLAPIRKGLPDGSCLVLSPTDQAESKDGGYPSRPVMPLLVAAQREAAHAQGCAFFSTYDWMGGKGSAAKWFAKGYVGTDFQHLSHKGANLLSDAIFDSLFAGFALYHRPDHGT